MTYEIPPLYYADYLELSKLLDSQHLRSAQFGEPAHDELLFIIVHQAYELWFKQILHELDSVLKIFSQDFIPEKDLGIASARLQRILKIQGLLVNQLDVLETMTPLDFLEFRNYLLPASGFQSYQFRLIENKLGLSKTSRLAYQKASYQSRLSPEHQKLVEEAEKQPNLLKLTEKWLERTPFLEEEDFHFWKLYRQGVDTMLEEEKKAILKNPYLDQEQREKQLQEWEKTKKNFLALFDPETHNRLVAKGSKSLSYRATQAALLISLYRDEPLFQMPFQYLTSLLNMDELWTTWRYRHALMVHRMIGTKIGTGGSSGYSYLKATVEKHRIFTDLFQLSTYLIPRRSLPPLPEKIRKRLNFFYLSE